MENSKAITILDKELDALKSQFSDLVSIRPEKHEMNLENWDQEVSKIKDILGSNQILLFIGPFSSGKSSFINAVLGEELLPTNSRACTAVCTEIHFVNDGRGFRGKVIKHDGSVSDEEYDVKQLINLIDGPKGAVGQCANFHHIELTYDVADSENENLKTLCAANVTLVDCPGYNSVYSCDEDIIDEYINKATHTFWMNPIDKFGGEFEMQKIKKIRSKTTTLIPVITKSDLKPKDSMRRQICDLFTQELGSLFRMKEPIFTSAEYYRQSQSKGISEEESDRLVTESGIYKFVSAMVVVTKKNEVEKSVVNLAKTKILDLLKAVNIIASKEQEYWSKQLKELGYDVNSGVNEIDNCKKKVDAWIKKESEDSGARLDDELINSICSYVDEVGEKFDVNKALEKMQSIYRTHIINNEARWKDEINRSYSNTLYEVNINKNSSINIPENLQTSIAEHISGTFNTTLSAISAIDTKTVMKGIGGSALICIAPIIDSVTIGGGLGGLIPTIAVGSAFSPFLLFGGVALLGASIFAFVPKYSKLSKDKRDEDRANAKNRVKTWIQQISSSKSIKGALENVNDKLYEEILELTNSKLKSPKLNYDKVQKVILDIKSIKDDIETKFAYLM